MIVYWIKRKAMTDPYLDGYIGVTSKPASKRLDEHSKNRYKKSHVKMAIDKYDDIEIAELHSGELDECLELEFQYRPRPYIGWNICIGGGKMPSMNPESAAKISKTLKEKQFSPYSKNTHSPESLDKRRATLALISQEKKENYLANPNICKNCNKTLPWTQRKGTYCSRTCCNLLTHRLKGHKMKNGINQQGHDV